MRAGRAAPPRCAARPAAAPAALAAPAAAPGSLCAPLPPPAPARPPTAGARLPSRPSARPPPCRRRFPGRTHHVWLEPEGLGTDVVYPNGISNSMEPEDQLRLLATVPGGWLAGRPARSAPRTLHAARRGNASGRRRGAGAPRAARWAAGRVRKQSGRHGHQSLPVFPAPLTSMQAWSRPACWCPPMQWSTTVSPGLGMAWDRPDVSLAASSVRQPVQWNTAASGPAGWGCA